MPKRAGEIVFHGNLSYPPNVDAVHWFINDVLPSIRRERPTTVFHAVGADPVPSVRDLAAQGRIRLSENLDDLRPAVCAGTLYVCPVRRGTGLKFKLLEAMAMAMPIVCSSISLSGIDAVHGRHLLVATSAQEFAAHVTSLIHAPAKAAALGLEGRRLVVTRYSWDSRARAFEALYEAVLAEAASGMGTNGSKMVPPPTVL